jgi:hypothetical protein
MKEEKRLSDFKDEKELLINFSLYTSIKIENQIKVINEDEAIWSDDEESEPTILKHTSFYENRDFLYLKRLLTGEVKIYSYCPFCHKDLILISKPKKELPEDFKSDFLRMDTNISCQDEYDMCNKFATEIFQSRYEYLTASLMDSNRNFSIDLQCTAITNHKMCVLFHLTIDNFLIKIGQYPSIIDFERNLREYKSVLKGSDLKELQQAVKLVSHGVGIGSFVYLRRIFEKLIFKKAKLLAEVDEHFTFDEFLLLPMDKKILTLREYLPKFLVENKLLYGVISKGIHELEDDECLQYFDIVKEAILIILDEEIASTKKEKRKCEVSKQLNNIQSGLKNKK